MDKYLLWKIPAAENNNGDKLQAPFLFFLYWFLKGNDV